MFGRGARKVTGRQFAEAVVDGITADLNHLYLMFQADGSVVVKWEQSQGDRSRHFRIVADAANDACPHCALLSAISRIGDVLSLGDDRVERVRREYASALETGMLPCPAFGRSPSVDTPFGQIPLILGAPGWMAECHVGHGDPSTSADCARHRRS